MRQRPGHLRIICTGAGRVAHGVVELAMVSWSWPIADEDDLDGQEPPRPRTPAGPEVPLRELSLSVTGDTFRRPRRRARQPFLFSEARRAPVEWRTRADGGTTLVLPPCPRCRRPAVQLRDDTLRVYVEKTRGTPMEGTLDLSHLTML